MSASKARIQKAQETRKRKRDEEAALSGFATYIHSAGDKDREFIINTMDEKPELVPQIARMLRDKTLEEALERTKKEAVAGKGRDLGKPLGKQTKHFKKLGITCMLAFLEQIANKFFPQAVDDIKGLCKGEKGDSISPEKVGMVWDFMLDVDSRTRLPTKHKHSEYTNPLMQVLMRRYIDCGNRLQYFKFVIGANLGFFSWSRTERPAEVKLNIFQKQVIKLPVADSEFDNEHEWQLINNTTQGASLVCEALSRRFKLFDWLRKQHADAKLDLLCKVGPFEYPDEVDGSDDDDDEDTETEAPSSTKKSPSSASSLKYTTPKAKQRRGHCSPMPQARVS